jgi:hypothetical protein
MPILDIMQSHPTGTGLPRIAKIKKGGEKIERTNAKGEKYLSVGPDLTYFRVAFAPEYAHLETEFDLIYGLQPTSLPVMFNGVTVHEVLDAWYEEWDSHGTLLHRCDGAKQAVCYNKATGFFEHGQSCVMPSCKCKKTARLELIMVGFLEATGVLGTITFETHADTDVRTLYARLSSYYAMFGTLRGIPFTLQRAPREISTPTTKKDPSTGKQVRTGERVKTTKSLVDLLVDPEHVKAHIKASFRKPALSQRAAPPALPSSPDAPQLPASTMEAHWTTVPERWSKFVDWAQGHNCTGEDLIRALEEVVQHDIRTPADFKADGELAMAAVLAYICKYDAKTVTEKKLAELGPKTALAVQGRALVVIKRREQELMSMVDTDPIPGGGEGADAQ